MLLTIFTLLQLKCITVFMKYNPVELCCSVPKNSKAWISSSKLSCRSSISPGPLEAVFFGPEVLGTTKCTGGAAGRLLQSQQLYQNICGLLVGAIVNLKLTLNEFSTVLPPNVNSQIGSPPFPACDSTERLQKLLQHSKVC